MWYDSHARLSLNPNTELIKWSHKSHYRFRIKFFETDEFKNENTMQVDLIFLRLNSSVTIIQFLDIFPFLAKMEIVITASSVDFCKVSLPKFRPSSINKV